MMSPEEIPALISVQERVTLSVQEKDVPEILELFRNGESMRHIARLFLPGHNLWVATNAIRLVLIWNIPSDEYFILTQKWKGARTQTQLWIWIHGQNSAQNSNAGKMWALKSWAHIYEDDETSRLLELIDMPEYRLWTRINAKKISNVLNFEFHNGEQVRNSGSVRQQVSRTKGKVEQVLVQSV